MKRSRSPKRPDYGRRTWSLAPAAPAAPVTTSSKPATEITPLESRSNLELERNVGKLTGVASLNAGFHCAQCKVLCKDSILWVNHLNSKSHQIHSGHGMRALKASNTDVIQRIKSLGADKVMSVDTTKSDADSVKSLKFDEVQIMEQMGLPTEFVSKRKR